VKLIRLVVSDLHLGTGVPEGQLNPLEDFFYDEHFAELLDHYDRKCGAGTQIELILNGDIFDLLKVQIEGAWPTEITAEIAERKLKQCLDGHPHFVAALRSLLQKPNRRCVYLPGNHDLDMWFPAPQELFKTFFSSGGTIVEYGQRFLTFIRSDNDREGARNPLTVVVNWQAALE